MGSKKNQKKKVKVDSKPTRVKRSSADLADSEGQDNGVQYIAPIEQDIPEGKHGIGTSIRRSTHMRPISTKLKMAAIIEEEAAFPADDSDQIPHVLVDLSPIKSKPGPAVVEDNSADFMPDQVQSGSESDSIPSESSIATNPTSKPVIAGKKDAAKSITFLVPDGTDADETRTRINIMSHTSFYMLINTLHDAIGCSGVKSKPKLKYKLTRVTKAMLMQLQSVEDWEGLKEEIETVQGKKKNQASVAVEIIVPDDYMESLRHTLGKGKNANKKGTGKGHGGHTQKEIKITNLNASDDERSVVSDDDHSRMSAKERGTLQALKETLTPCDLNTCRNERCKLRAWAEALAAGTYGVTYKVPPNSKHFEKFHSNTANAVANAGTAEPTRIRAGHAVLGSDGPYPVMGQMAGHTAIGNNGSYPLMGQPQTPHPAFYHPYAPQYGYHNPMQMMELAMAVLKKGQGRTRSPSPATGPSSNGPEITAAHAFPTISDFIDMLTIQPDAQDRDLELFKTQFQSEHVHYIDELRGLTAEELKDQFGFAWGDAWFIHKAVEKAIHRVDKARKNMWQAKRARHE
ncbi:hypothetical protein JB92DRAFT_3116288 [Gautieria morchelliformis]|nr:hypothetical protein JB92DRAFT_3116288 [Gautieria morchelliformis]